ncbi:MULTISPECIES: M42 family metallopeptidase [unclassified Methanosarcina]|uniref:M42 family metallopeptidase n=1 Tax=unclassified Methanosarcina TaxID=2644672 RepID=UPI0006161D45|nr:MULTISPECIES: M42 family metallopeptidase [unclassified Methanosarcina]AKB17721.1 Tetrahedral aminopeptidase [Methanosarcina sp. WWM596]AKB21077.1 Tetrahedral aminopeptidase [Methanosarcina sp. WH1]
MEENMEKGGNLEEITSFLEKFTNAHGISGFEDDVRKLLEKELEPYVDSMREDTMGNLIAVKEGNGPSIMLAAHMDEIGLMVRYIDDNGFLRFVGIGGWFNQTLLNQRVVVHGKKGAISGVIGSKPPHVMKDEDRKKPVKLEDMFIDIGAKDREDAGNLGIEIGTAVSIDREFVSLANGKVTSKAFDNRAGVVILIEVMKQLHKRKIEANVYAVGTVQEEVGLKGAKTCAFGLCPNVALALDTTIPGDHPGINKTDSAMELGKGPVITVADASGRGLIAHPRVLRWLRETADANEIPYQLGVGSGGTTDATSIHLTKEGIPTGTVSIATRYIHSPVEVLDTADIETCVSLIVKAIENVKAYF